MEAYQIFQDSRYASAEKRARDMYDFVLENKLCSPEEAYRLVYGQGSEAFHGEVSHQGVFALCCTSMLNPLQRDIPSAPEVNGEDPPGDSIPSNQGIQYSTSTKHTTEDEQIEWMMQPQQHPLRQVSQFCRASSSSVAEFGPRAVQPIGDSASSTSKTRTGPTIAIITIGQLRLPRQVVVFSSTLI